MRTMARRHPVSALLLALLALGALGIAGALTYADAQEGEERSRLVRFVERQISTPNRQIRLGAIEGALSSDVRLASITIADREGVWLTIEDVRLVWSRRALLLGRLEIERLEAERIEVARPPLPDREAAGDDEPIDDTPFQVPDLPVSVRIESLAVPVVDIAEGVIGPAARLSVDGRIVLAGGALETDVSIERLDRPGRLGIQASFSNETRNLAIDVTLTEPADGVLANALDIEGRPPIAFEIAGSGPLDDFSADIRLDAANETLLSGATTLSRVAEGLRFQANLSGNVARLVPETYQELVADGTRLVLDGTVRDEGGVSIATGDLSSGALALTFSGAFGADGVPTALDLDARLGREDGEPIDLPGGGGEAEIGSGRIVATLGGPIGQRWNASILFENLRSPLLSADRVALNGGGEAVNMASAGARRVTFDVTGTAAGLVSEDPAVADALGNAVSLEARGSWNAGEPADVAVAEITSNGTRVGFSGSAGASGVIGDFRLAADDLAAFAGLANRDLAGAVDLSAEGSIDPSAGLFDLTLDGEARDLAVGIDSVDGLLAGTTTLSGGAARAAAGFSFDDLTLRNDQLDVAIDGQTTGATVALSAEATIAELAAVSPDLSGRLDLGARLAGPNQRPEIEAVLTGQRIVLDGTALEDLLVRLDGRLEAGAFAGTFDANGTLGGEGIDASGRIRAGGDDPFALEDLFARIGDATVEGNLAGTEAGPVTGTVTVDVPRLATLAPLLLTDASGSLTADVTLTAEDDRQDAAVAARARAIEVADASVGFADIDLTVRDATGVPVAEGTASVRDASVAGFTARSADLSASRSGEGTRFTLDAALARADLSAAGTLVPADGGFALTLETLRLAGEELALANEAEVTVRDGAVTIDGLTLTAGGGRIAVEGTLAERVDLTARIDAFPIAVANLAYPPLEASGSVTGALDASGTRAAPEASFALEGRRLTAAPLAEAGLEPVDATLRGSLSGGTLTLSTGRVAVGGGTVTARGTASERRLDLTVDLADLPLALANAFAPDLDVSGTLGGSARVTGSPARPEATIDLSAPAVSAAPLASAGIGSLAVTATGGFRNDTVRIDAARATGSGLEVTASGRVPLSGPGLSVDVRATAPLALAERFVAERGATISGDVAADVAVRGSIARPTFSGEVRAGGIRFLDPDTGITLTGGEVVARLTGQQVVIERVSADLGGGTVSATGTIGIDAAAGFPADITVALRGARYVSDIVTATASGDITLEGPLLRTPVLGGVVTIGRAEITVPDRLPGGPTLIDVAQINAPPDVLATLRRARVGPYAPRTADDAGGGGGFRLDLTIRAPQQIFVRGRGIDAELGGQLTLTGTTSDVVPVGQFDLIRGRIEFLTQRITFDRGSVTLVGDFDPLLDFLAETSSKGITVQILVTGPASNPDIRLSSVPELPQDEILAQLLFGRSIADLNAAQLAQLAASAASLAGGGGPSFTEQIRRLTGLDDLSVVTQEEGGVGVAAGRYIADNIYLGVEAGEEESDVSVNIDVTRSLKLRGTAGTRDSSLGFFFEREY